MGRCLLHVFMSAKDFYISSILWFNENYLKLFIYFKTIKLLFVQHKPRLLPTFKENFP